MEEGSHQDKGKPRAHDTSYEMSPRIIRSTSPPATTTPPIASSSSHPDSLDQEPFLSPSFSLFSKHRPIDIEQGLYQVDKGKSRADDTSHKMPSQAIKSTSPPPVASSSSHESHPIQCAQPEVEELKFFMEGNKIRTTRWRVLNTYFLLIVGTAKSVSAYRNASTAATSLDLVIGIFWALISYWFSLFETEHPSIIPWLFKPIVLDMWKTVAPILFPSSFYLCLSLSVHVILFLDRLSTHLDGRGFPGLFPVFLMIFMLVYIGGPLAAVHFIPIWYPIWYSKLCFIIKLGFNSSDWEVTPMEPISLITSSVASFLIFTITFIGGSIVWIVHQPEAKESPDFMFFIVLAAGGLSLLLTYLVIGFGRTCIRLAKSLIYNETRSSPSCKID